MWKFTIWDAAGNQYNIDEPVGWDGITLRLRRDKDWHGFFEFMDDEISTLQFDGVGRDILAGAFDDFGIEARVRFTIEYLCSGNTYEELWTGHFDFTTYRFVCGDRCYVEINATADNCLMKLRNRYDQKINLDTTFSINGTSLPPYTSLNRGLTLPGVEVSLEARGEMKEDWESVDSNDNDYVGWSLISPPWDIIISDLKNFVGGVGVWGGTAGYANTWSSHANGDGTIPLAELLVFETAKNLNCSGEFTLEFNISGHASKGNIVGYIENFSIQIAYGSDITSTGINLEQTTLLSNFNSMPFTYSNSHTFNLQPGEKVWLFFSYDWFGTVANSQHQPYLKIDAGSYIRIVAKTICSPTTSKVYLVNEALSRVTEAITDNCMKTYSEYYGRTDSQPYTVAGTEDGCGSRRALTHGLNIRGATMIDNTQPRYALSLKELFDNLTAIDNIGMGIEPDANRPGYNWLRIEPYPYFYQNDVLFTASNVAELEMEVRDELYVSRFLVGYNTWETESVNGAYELFASREYHTDLTTVRTTLDRVCKFIASGTTMEITRREFGMTTKDWRYDNNTFIICLRRNMFGSLLVDMGIVAPGSINTHNPDTVYNLSISPARNAMRHLNLIHQSIGFGNSLMFGAGEGNYKAGTSSDSSFCKLEFSGVHEDSAINVGLFADTDLANPVYKNLLVKFEYPLSYQAFKTIKANPYGLIEYSCANGPMQSGWIENLRYSPEKGMATFEIKPKYFQ